MLMLKRTDFSSKNFIHLLHIVYTQTWKVISISIPDYTYDYAPQHTLSFIRLAKYFSEPSHLIAV